MDSIPLAVVVVLAAVGVAVFTDLRSFKIYNVLTVPLIVSGVVYHGIMSGTAGLVSSVVGAVVGFGVFFFIYVLGGMGGGDVKLMAGVGAWLWAPATLVVAVAASIAAGVYALVIIFTGGRARDARLHLAILLHRIAAIGRHLAAEDSVERAVGRDDRRARLIPFGAMIGIGLVALILIARWRPPS